MFCLIPLSLGATFRILIYRKWPIGSLDHWFASLKRTPYSFIYLNDFHNFNAMGNEINKPRRFFWLVLRLWRPTRFAVSGFS